METSTRAVSALRGTNQRWWNEERSIHIASIPVVSTGRTKSIIIQNCVLQRHAYVERMLLLLDASKLEDEKLSPLDHVETGGVCSRLFLSPLRSELDTVRYGSGGTVCRAGRLYLCRLLPWMSRSRLVLVPLPVCTLL